MEKIATWIIVIIIMIYGCDYKAEKSSDIEEWKYELVDLDNDNEIELFIRSIENAYALDIRNGQVYVLDKSYGSCGVMGYTTYGGKTYIVHSDITHLGRENYFFTLYDGKGEVIDRFELNKEYTDMETADMCVCTYQGEEISEEEFEAIKEKMLWH